MTGDLQRQAQLIKLGHRAYTPNYSPRDVVFERGEGSYLWDIAGNRYLDFGSGIGVNCLGHRNAQLIEALHSQIDRLWHTSNVYFSQPPVLLATELIAKTFAERVFFCNSGAEANEAAIKVARKYGFENYAQTKHTIITFSGSFHGRTIATVTATAQPKYHRGFEPLPKGFRYSEFNDINALREMMNDDVCAVLLEPIQGEGGVRPFSIDFLQQVRKLCDQHDALLIFDEVQCGMGRSGKLFAYQWAEDVVPDIVTIAKAFGGGLPIGATLLNEKVADILNLGSHGSTFGGNPICCEVARVIFDKVSNPGFLAEISAKGELLRNCMRQIQNEHEMFDDIRGKGLMIGAQIDKNRGEIAGEIMRACMEKGLLVLQSGVSVIRLLPPFTVSEEEIQQATRILADVVSSFR